MSDLPDNLLYTDAHEWIRIVGDGTAEIGITEYAQSSLGDITFVEFPEIGATLGRGDSFGVVESVKAASDLYMPVSGEVLEINESVDSSPELVNQKPYSEGWLLKVRMSDTGEVSELLTPEAYFKLI